MADLYRVYRRGDDPKTSQDWAIRATIHGVEMRVGPTGGLARTIEIAAANCQDGTPEAEVVMQTERKVADGYVAVGWGDYTQGRLNMTRHAPGSRLYWEANIPVPRTKMAALLDEIVAALGKAGVNATPLASTGSDDEPESTLGIAVETPAGVWQLDSSGAGGDAGVWRGGGTVTRAQGVVPVLVLMRLAREHPEAVGFADDDAAAFTIELRVSDPWVGCEAGPLEVTEAIAVELGLCHRIRAAGSRMQDARPAIYF